MIQQTCCSSVYRAICWGTEGPDFDSQSGRIFFSWISFKRGDEPNGEEQEQEEQQLK